MFPSVMTDAERIYVITLSGCCANIFKTGIKANKVVIKSFSYARMLKTFYFSNIDYYILRINHSQ